MHTGSAGGGTSRLDREIARARRHSLLVRTLRVGLPVAAVVMVAGGILVTWAARSIPGNVSVAATTIDARGIVMQDPRMSGFDKSNRPYTMVADRAIQQLGGTGVVDLEGIKANVAMSDSATADIVAAKGWFDQGAQKLRLSDAIRVVTSDGMTVNLAAADIDLKTGSLAGSGPVEIVSDGRTIRAGSLTVRNGGEAMSFGRRVRMTLHPDPAGPPPGGRPSLNPSSGGDAPRPVDFSSIDVR